MSDFSAPPDPQPAVLVVTDNYYPLIGGVANHIHQLCTALTKLGCRLHLLSLTIEGPPPSDYAPNFSFSWKAPKVRNMGYFRGRELAWTASKECQGLMEEKNLQLVHFHTRGHLSKALRSLEAPKVFTNHTSKFLKFLAEGKRGQLLAEVDHADAFIAPSQELVSSLQTLGINPEKINYLPNGVDSKLFTPASREKAKRLWKLPQDRCCILCARRLVEKNGIAFLAEALPDLTEPYTLVLAGNRPPESRPPYEREVCNKLAQLPDVRFLGEVPNQDMVSLYQACEISVIPSLVEATSLTALESMSSGCAVVATEVGGLPELLEHEKNGLLVPPALPSALTASLDRLLRSPELRENLGRRARESVMDGFQWSQIAQKTLNIYRDLVADSFLDGPVHATGAKPRKPVV